MIQPRAISNSQLTAFKRSPAHWLQYVKTPKKQTEAMLLGSVAHCLALEKENFEKKYFLMDLEQMPEPKKDFRIKVNSVWKEEQLERAHGLDVVTSEELTRAGKMVEALYSDEVAVKYLQRAQAFESKLEWNCLGLNFLGIRDITGEDYIADLKFVSNADPYAFKRYLFNNGVYRQGGMYLDGEMGGEFTGDPHKRVLFIAVESEEPFGVSVNELQPEVITFGISEYRMLSQQLKMCLDNDYFPGYQHRSINGSFDVFLPTYIESV